MQTSPSFFRLTAVALVLPAAAWAAPVVSEPALEPVKPMERPSSKYDSENRSFNMALGSDITHGGRIWAAWIGGGDSDAAYLIAATSENGGRTWSKPALVIDPHRYELESQGLPKRRTLVGNFWTDPSGRLWLFYDQSLGFFDGRAGVWAINSTNPDEKRPSWSQPRRLFDGALLNKPIVTSKGDWLIFASLWSRILISPKIFSEGHHELDDSRGINVYRSRDQGQTWQRISLIRIPDPLWNFDEPSAIELKSGVLWMLIRTGQGLLETFSDDGGVIWSKPVRSGISSTVARVFLKRLSSGNILLVKYGRVIDANSGRAELTAYISKDDGRRWLGGLVIDERKPVTYPDGYQAKDGSIHIFYDYDREGAAEILLSVFSEEEVLAGKFADKNDLKRVLVNKATKAKPPVVQGANSSASGTKKPGE